MENIVRLGQMEILALAVALTGADAQGIPEGSGAGNQNQ